MRTLPDPKAMVELRKVAKILTELKPHQQRVLERIQKEDQPGLIAVHGLGTGKTLTSIAAHDVLNQPGEAIVPAALQDNYLKEIARHRVQGPDTKIRSIQNMAFTGEAPTAPVLIVDEAHRARDPSSKAFQTLKKTKAQKRLLLSGTPFYNYPHDVAPLIELASGQKLLPTDKGEFEKQYVTNKVIKPSVGQRFLNVFRSKDNQVKPGTVPILNPAKEKELSSVLNKWIDYYEGTKDGFPDVQREDVRVPMTKKQLETYDTLLGQAPLWVRMKIKHGLPPSKKESKDLNAFMGGIRQVSNTTSPFHASDRTPEEPKIEMAFNELNKTLQSNPQAKGVVYSNYLNSGLEPYKKRLDKAGIPYKMFTGEISKKERDQAVRDYNAGKLRALLISGAGGEGLDLKGTRVLQVLEPHWNVERIRQVEGRAARYRSHAHLPPEHQNVKIQRFLSTRPAKGIMENIGLKNPGLGVDEYLAQMSENKERLNQQFKALLKPQQLDIERRIAEAKAKKQQSEKQTG